jgi:hypothetical protein
MASLNDYQSNVYTKLLLVGDSKVGKTTSLWALVNAGYLLRIMDFDNLLDSLRDKVMSECADMAKNVDVLTFRDKYKGGPLGPVLDGPAKAFIDAIKSLDNWPGLGKPSEWGEETILVIDSLSRLCDAAYSYHRSIAPAKEDGRAAFFASQRAVEMILANLTSKAFQTNVIVICHGIYQELPDGTTKIFPYGVGQKLSPKIPSYFPVYVRYKNIAGKRSVQLESDSMIDLAMPKFGAFKEKTLPAETGLATIFETLRGDTTPAAPKAVLAKAGIRRV